MNYEELVANVKKAVKKAKVSKTVGHVAFQFNVEGEAEGAFYLELDDGKINVEPFEYYDRDLIIVASADVIMLMIEGEVKPREAYAKELLKVSGNVELLNVLPFGDKYKEKIKVKGKGIKRN